MSVRTIETTVTFAHPFVLASFDRPQPAGTYRVVTEEEEIEGLSFPAYRRLSTTLHTPAVTVISAMREAFPVNAEDLEAALKADAGEPGLSSGADSPEE
jgi:hypothetical protein